MNEIEEAIVNGFCKAMNQTRSVFCEFEKNEAGAYVLAGYDCDFGECPHSESCRLMEQTKTPEDLF